MANSSLVNYTKLSPHCNKPRNDMIKKITIHMVAGDCTVEILGEIFAAPNRRASSNYGIGSDGRVGLYVNESDRSWCSGSRENDHQAITIEVANDGGAPEWHVSDKAMAKLIDLCVDICQRNNIKKINFTGDKNGNLTMHKYFEDTSCPGLYLESKFPYIAKQVNIRLGVENPDGQIYKNGEIIMFKGGKQYNNAYATIGTDRKAGLAKVTKYYDEEGSKHHYHLIGEKNSSNVYGWVDEENIEPVKKEDLVVKKDLINVDGIWGKDTTLKTQKVFKTIVDGIISKQNVNSKQYLQNVSETSWQFVESNKATGSNLIRAIQKLVKADVDGKCGRGTIKAMQNFLNRNGFSVGKVDGYMGEKTVRGWQNYINSRL